MVDLKVLVKQRRHAAHHALLLQLPQALVVPLAQALLARHALAGRVHVEDVAVAALRRARPDVRRLKAAVARGGEVRRQQLVVRHRARRQRAQVLHAVQVCNVHLVGIGRGAVSAVLLHVQRKEAHVGAVQALEQEHDALPVGVRLGVPRREVAVRDRGVGGRPTPAPATIAALLICTRHRLHRGGRQRVRRRHRAQQRVGRRRRGGERRAHVLRHRHRLAQRRHHAHRDAARRLLAVHPHALPHALLQLRRQRRVRQRRRGGKRVCRRRQHRRLAGGGAVRRGGDGARGRSAGGGQQGEGNAPAPAAGRRDADAAQPRKRQGANAKQVAGSAARRRPCRCSTAARRQHNGCGGGGGGASSSSGWRGSGGSWAGRRSRQRAATVRALP